MRITFLLTLFGLSVVSIVLFFYLSVNPIVSALPRPILEEPLQANSSPHIIAAGVPMTPDAKSEALQVMSTLASNNISIFYPTFQYQEQPEPLTLGYEEDFLLLCDSPSPAQQAMIESGVKLLIPGEIFYHAAPLPPLHDDPVKKLIDCLGREHIAGVTNYDEAIHVGVDMSHVKALYERVKAIDETLPVFMIHAPLLSDEEPGTSEKKRQDYLQTVAKYSAFADVIGFDVYATPPEIAKVTSPYAGGVVMETLPAVEEYLVWLHDVLSDKEYIMVYQGFGFADQYSTNELEAFPQEIQDLGNMRLTATEVGELYDVSSKYGVDFVAWWGQAMAERAHPTWDAILEKSRAQKTVNEL